MRRCNVCLTSKAVRHKLYGQLQSLPVPTYRWKDLSIDFVTGLSISTDWKEDSYDSILVIVNWLTKMVHYEPVKVTIDAPGLAKVIIDVAVRHLASRTQSSPTKGRFSPRSSGHCYAISLASSGSYQPASILRQMSRPKGRIVQWKPISEPLLISNRMIKQGFYQWPSSPIIIPRMLAPVIPLLSSITDTILVFSMRMILIPAQNHKLRKNNPQNSESWWPFANRTYTMQKSFRNGVTTRGSSSEAIY